MTDSPALDRRPTPNTKKIMTLSKRVAAYRAEEAGSLKAAYDRLGSTVKLLADAHGEVDQIIQGEVDLLLKMVKRFRQRVKDTQHVGSDTLTLALRELGNVEKILIRAQGRGYGTKALVASSQVDFNRLKQLRASIGLRAREAAFILAALEQAADPLPGIRIANAAERRRNDKKRAAASPSPTVVEAPAPTETSQPQ